MTKALAEFECDATKWSRFVETCARRGEDPAALLSDFVRLKLKNWDHTAKRELATDERLLVRLRLLVAEALSESQTWHDMAFALDKRGLAFQPSGGGLVLIDARTNRPLCKASEVGPSYARLVRRFASPNPAYRKAGSAAASISRVA